MIKPEQIPEEVFRALCASMGCEWAMQDKEDQIIIRRHIAAALNAWPRMEPHKVLTVRDNGEGYDLKQVGIILPLPQEARDE
jgi:hypothetical protein